MNLALAEHLRTIHRDGSGVIELHILQREDMAPLLAAAYLGESTAAQLALAVNDALRNIQNPPGKQPMLCCCCARPLEGGNFAIGLAMPSCTDATGALAFAVCEQCATTRNEIMSKAMTSLRAIWPDLQPVSFSAGHA